MRLFVLTANFAWPLVLTLGIVAGAVRRQRMLFALAYAAVFIVLDQ